MGNFQERLANTSPIQKFSDSIENIEDNRSQFEIQISNKLVEALTCLNSSRVMSMHHFNASELNWSQHMFVCIHGIPAVKDQFDFLQIPGQKVHFTARSFCFDFQTLSDHQKLKRFNQSMFDQQAKKMNELISKIQPSKKLVLVYHSFGNFILSAFLNLYGANFYQRIKGMIDIAGAPRIFYSVAKMFTPIIIQTSTQEIIKESDKIHKIFTKIIKSTGFPINFVDKYQTLSFLNYMKSQNFGKTFKNTENHPKILKLIVHGANDVLFQTTLLNDKAIFFAYKRPLEQHYASQISEKYNKLFKPETSPKNIQQRFIFNIPGGTHSVHMQKINHKLIKEAFHQYLILIHQ